MVRVYNTLSKTKEEFKTVRPHQVGIYLCGPTVYKPSHIGHMVGPVIFDAVKRYLTYKGYDVTFVINITDVDDKLIAEAKNQNRSMQAVADDMTADYMSNLEAMGVKESVNAFPKVSDHIGEIIHFTQDLIDKGFAYESEGDVYFDVGQFSQYGKLSHRSLEQMSGEGGSTASRKHTPFDFALWKAAKQPDEPSWDSPWGKGRPGWHIECSAMSHKLLGETFDIHGGGLDLVFPHHENEVAQNEARFGKPMCNYWMHNGLMQASSEVGKMGGRKTKSLEDPTDEYENQEFGKISKSKGSNAFSDMLKQVAPEIIRFFLLSTHYRRPIDFSMERIEEVAKGLEGFYRFFKRYEKVTGQNFYQIDAPCREEHLHNTGHNTVQNTLESLRQKFIDFMDDDFNTGGAIGVLFDLLRALNKLADENDVARLNAGATLLRELACTLGLFLEPPKARAGFVGEGYQDAVAESARIDELVGHLMTLLIELRQNARQNKDFALADKIRNGLTSIGITLEDGPDGTQWN